jgi:predicted kinase
MAIYVFTGVPLHGKTTIARIISARLGVTLVDRDDIFEFLFGNPGVATNTLAGMHGLKTSLCHYLLLAIGILYILMGKEIILVGVFTRPKRQASLTWLCKWFRRKVKIVCCYLDSSDEDEIQRRLELRNQDPSYA